MLDSADRYHVERVKRARTIGIVINEGLDYQLIINVRQDVRDIKKLAHDVALAFQDYFNVRRP